MGIVDANGKMLHGGWCVAAKPCDSCDSAAALVFCRADSAFLCTACDERSHRGRSGHHERVWMCEVCEQAPAAVTCKADAAALCVTCDRDIHSANPLARRHERIPVVPFYEPAASLLKPSTTVASFLVPTGAAVNPSAAEEEGQSKALEEAEAASWILPNPNNNTCNHKFVENTSDHDIKPTDFLFGDADSFVDFDYSAPMDARFADSVVPVQNRSLPTPMAPSRRGSENCFELDFTRSKLTPYSYGTQSLSQSVSSEVGVVPDGNSMSDVSFPLGGKQISSSGGGGGGGGDLSSSAASQATQLSGTEREARVLRYREKRKNRKFEKTIRYASRKAYAETRPRIKGRFAKRTEIEADVDACFYGAGSGAAAAFELADAGYGVVPSF